MIASLIIIFILLIILTFVWPPDSPWSPWWRTTTEVARAACKLADVSEKDIVYELGSGDGEFTLVSAKEFHSKKSIGIEVEHTRYSTSKIKKFFRNAKNAEFVLKDFKTVNLSKATVVYFYLVPAVINRILPKLKKELKPGTKIVSLKYTMPLKLLKKDKENELYLYKI